MKTFYWLLKREYWEHRGQLLWTPVISGAIFLLINAMAIVAGEVIGRRNHFHIGSLSLPDFDHVDPRVMQRIGLALDTSMYVIAGAILSITALVMFFYCLGALFDDRRDRSVLLWKSLPISDRDTVLSKLATAVVVAPLIACVVGVIVAWLVMVLFAATTSLHGIGGFEMLWQAHPLRVGVNLLLALPIYVLWALPTAGWLLLCSAWSRGRPFLWAILIPVGSAAMISWLSLMGLADGLAEWVWKHIVVRALLSLFPGGWLPSTVQESIDAGKVHVHSPADAMALFGLGKTYAMLGSTDLWIGVAAGVLMLAGAIWLRRWRDDS